MVNLVNLDEYLKSQGEVSDFCGIWCESLAEATVQNFRLLFLPETGFFFKVLRLIAKMK